MRECPKCKDKMVREPSLDETIQNESGNTLFVTIAFICRSCGEVNFETPEE